MANLLMQRRRMRGGSSILAGLFPPGSAGVLGSMGAGYLKKNVSTDALADGDPISHLIESHAFAGKTVDQHLAGQPELVTNGGFDADTDWNKSTYGSISGGVAHFNGVDNSAFISQSYTPAFKYHTISFDILNSGGSAQYRLGADMVYGSNYFNNSYEVTGDGSYSRIGKPTVDGGTVTAFYGLAGHGAFDIDNLSLKEINSSVFEQLDLGKQPTLRLHPSGEPYLQFDGLTQYLATLLGSDAALSDASLIWAFRSNDDKAMMFTSASGSKYAGLFQSGGSGSSTSGIGTPSLYINNAPVANDRGAFHTAGIDGTWKVGEYRNGDFSGLADFLISGYNGSGWGYNGDINANFMIVPTSQFLTDNRAAIYNLVTKGTGLTF